MAKKNRTGIPRPTISGQNEPLKFSFKHFHSDHRTFNISKCNSGFFLAVFERLQNYSNWPVRDFCDQNNKDRRHVIDFEKTTEKSGFIGAPGVDEDQLSYLEPWQFGLRKDQNWRVHGFLVDDTFYIVWFDPLHELCDLNERS